jgi:glycosyltransferase involved in cell wall biosynthesis
MVVPADWVRVLSGLDVIVAPSDFSRDTFERVLPDVPVISMAVPLWLPETVHAQHDRFGLQADTVYFGSSFEPQSDPARKNPFAVLDAFNLAFPARGGVGLTNKVNNGTVDGRVHPALEDLRARTRGDKRIVLLEDSLDYDAVLALYASLDVFVSLHRSEGIGLALMEAMALGKPVIATGWSGNMSFMDRSTACLLPYRLVPVRSGMYVYSEAVLGRQAVWAEPDLAQAADWMRVLVDRPDVRLAIGAKARNAMRRYQDEAHRAEFLDQLHSIRESEVSWGIGRARRAARRDQLEGSILTRNREPAGSARAWIQRLRSLATRSALWPPGRSAKLR